VSIYVVVTAGVTMSDVDATGGALVTFVNCKDEAPLTCQVSVELWPGEMVLGVARRLEITGSDGGGFEV
jgi:hypothetical protein